MNVLVDTSVWSVALRRKKENQINPVILKLTEMIEQSRVNMIGPIRQEILSGISQRSEFLRLKEIMSGFKDLLINTEMYERAAEMSNICRKEGIQGSSVDFLICSVSERYHLSIFTLDKDFELYSTCIPIKLEL